MDTDLSQDSRGFWISWIFANAFGWTSGMLISYALFMMMGGDFARLQPGNLLWLVLGGVAGFFVGIIQQVALYRGGYSLERWTFTTIIGLALSAFAVPVMVSLLVTIDSLVAYVLVGAAFGVPLAGMQWQTLKREVKSGGILWLIASILGSMVMLGTSVLPAMSNAPLTLCFIGPLAYGGITGLVLDSLLRFRPIPAPSEEPIFTPRSAPATRARTQSPPPPMIHPGK